jgi:hypothetical protein
MSATPECLDDIIGLSQTVCECFTGGNPFDISKSNLYLDEVEGLNLKVIDSISDCEEGSLWDILNVSRREGIKSFKADLMASLLTKYKKKRNPFSGVIGSEKFKTNLNIQNTYAGVRVQCANIIGGIMSVRRIGLVFNETKTFTLDVYDSLHDISIATYEVTSQAGKLSWFNLPSPLQLDLNYEAANEPPDYYFVYSISESGQPKDIKAGCGCGGGTYKYYWNTKNPVYKTYEKDRWSEYIMITGASGSDINDKESWGTSEQLNGIILDAEFKCKIGELICKDELDFETNETAIAMAYAVRYRSAAIVVDKILASPHPNIYTMTDRERLMQKKNTYTTEYKNYISWLTDNINHQANDCLTCNDFDDIVKVGILS